MDLTSELKHKISVLQISRFPFHMSCPFELLARTVKRADTIVKETSVQSRLISSTLDSLALDRLSICLVSLAFFLLVTVVNL